MKTYLWIILICMAFNLAVRFVVLSSGKYPRPLIVTPRHDMILFTCSAIMFGYTLVLLL